MVGKPSAEGTKFPFTKKALAKLPVPAAGRKRYLDSTCPGLVLSVTPTSRVFYLYKKFNSKPVEYRIGPWPGLSIENARKAMKAAELIYANGGDPHAARKANAPRADAQGLVGALS